MPQGYDQDSETPPAGARRRRESAGVKWRGVAFVPSVRTEQDCAASRRCVDELAGSSNEDVMKFAVPLLLSVVALVVMRDICSRR